MRTVTAPTSDPDSHNLEESNSEAVNGSEIKTSQTAVSLPKPSSPLASDPIMYQGSNNPIQQLTTQKMNEVGERITKLIQMVEGEFTAENTVKLATKEKDDLRIQKEKELKRTKAEVQNQDQAQKQRPSSGAAVMQYHQ